MPPAHSNKKRMVLFLSNGDGEDLIAATIIKKLLEECPYLSIRALPLVGEGRAYDEVGIKVLGSRKIMPSSGFVGSGLFVHLTGSSYSGREEGVRSLYGDILYYLCLQ